MNRDQSPGQSHLIDKDPAIALYEQRMAETLPNVGFLHAYFYLWSPYLTSVLLELGMSADIIDMMGVTPLMYCVMHGHRKSIRVLLSAGADVHMEWKGETALGLAEVLGKVGCALLLLQHDATLTIPEEKPYQALRGLIYLLHKGIMSKDLLRILRLYLL